jgi:hypothetical protein
MKVLIVAKTRQGSRACVGGITTEGQSVRLRAADYDTDESAGMEYEVGEVWDMEITPAPSSYLLMLRMLLSAASACWDLRAISSGLSSATCRRFAAAQTFIRRPVQVSG